MELNNKNFNALSYKVKALMALERHSEALIHIKEALSIKYNKTLYKYLVDIENIVKIEKIEEEKDNKNSNKKKLNHREEYKNMFKHTNNSLFDLNEKEKEEDENNRENNKNTKNKKSDKKNSLEKNKFNIDFPENKNSSIINLFGMHRIYKFIYLCLTIIKSHLKKHRSLYFAVMVIFGYLKRGEIKDLLIFLQHFFYWFIGDYLPRFIFV